MMAKIVEQALENTDTVRVKVISSPPIKVPAISLPRRNAFCLSINSVGTVVMSILLVAALRSESYAGTQSPNSTVNVSALNVEGGGYGSYLEYEWNKLILINIATNNQ